MVHEISQLALLEHVIIPEGQGFIILVGDGLNEIVEHLRDIQALNYEHVGLKLMLFFESSGEDDLEGLCLFEQSVHDIGEIIESVSIGGFFILVVKETNLPELGEDTQDFIGQIFEGGKRSPIAQVIAQYILLIPHDFQD